MYTICKMALPQRLSVEEEKKYVEAYFENGDQEARNVLIEHNLRLIPEVIKRNFVCLPYDREDLMSDCIVALQEALDKYNPQKDVLLGSYLYSCIKNFICLKIRTDSTQKRGGDILTLSLENTKLYKEDDRSEVTLKETVVSDEDVQEDVANKLYRQEMMKQIVSIVEKMKPIWQRVFYAYWGINGYEKLNMRQIAKNENLSYQRIAQIVNKVMFYVKKGLNVKAHYINEEEIENGN